MNRLAASDPSTCPYCKRTDMTVYLRDMRAIGCAACLGEFFEALRPTQRPWAMTFWDDLKSLFRRGKS